MLRRRLRSPSLFGDPILTAYEKFSLMPGAAFTGIMETLIRQFAVCRLENGGIVGNVFIGVEDTPAQAE